MCDGGSVRAGRAGEPRERRRDRDTLQDPYAACGGLCQLPPRFGVHIFLFSFKGIYEKVGKRDDFVTIFRSRKGRSAERDRLPRAAPRRARALLPLASGVTVLSSVGKTLKVTVKSQFERAQTSAKVSVQDALHRRQITDEETGHSRYISRERLLECVCVCVCQKLYNAPIEMPLQSGASFATEFTVCNLETRKVAKSRSRESLSTSRAPIREHGGSLLPRKPQKKCVRRHALVQSARLFDRSPQDPLRKSKRIERFFFQGFATPTDAAPHARAGVLRSRFCRMPKFELSESLRPARGPIYLDLPRGISLSLSLSLSRRQMDRPQIYTQRRVSRGRAYARGANETRSSRSPSIRARPVRPSRARAGARARP